MPIWNYQDPPVLSFSPKRIAEVLTLGMDFVNVLGPGETILSGYWYIIPVRPLNAPSPIQMILGSPNVSGTRFYQQIASGTEGVLYNVVAKVSTNFNNVIESKALLLTTNDAFEAP